MAVQVAVNTPLAEALGGAVQSKLVEMGWTAEGSDDASLSEYIILMLVNGKSQEQIATELSTDLLDLGPDDPGAGDFSRWLFEQVELLNAQLNGGTPQAPQQSTAQSIPSFPDSEAARLQNQDGQNDDDAEMGDSTDQSGAP